MPYHRKLRNGGAMPTDVVSGIKACEAAASADDLGLSVARVSLKSTHRLGNVGHCSRRAL